MTSRIVRIAAAAGVALVAWAGSATAGPVGDTVFGTLAFGPNGSFGGQFWSPQSTTITDPPLSGPEYLYVDFYNADSVDFTNDRIYIIDENLNSDANGFEMTFQLTSGDKFSGLSLIVDTFGPNLTYSLNNGLITFDWTGSSGEPFGQYEAVFNYSVTAAPEPLTLSIFGAGLAGAVAMRRRRK